MKALIQRVQNAKVTVNGEVISSIGQGACILIGINTSDTIKDMEYIIRKILSIRIFEEEDKKWHKTVVDKQYEILCVSQFTLYNTWKGNKPDFHKAMGADRSKEFYEQFIQKLKEAYSPDKVKDGLFGAYMQVSIQNDGPVTLEIESPSHSNEKANNWGHFPENIPPTESKQHPTKRCRVCYQHNIRKETTWQCKQCKVPLHLPSCFEKFHT